MCSWGVEIFDKETNNKTLNQATGQIAYAFADQIIESMDNQVKKLMVEETIFYHIPVITTTASLHLLNKDITPQKIESADSIDEVSKQYDSLILKYSPNIDLKRQSIDTLYEYFKKEVAPIEARTNESDIIKSKMSAYAGNLNRLIDIYSNLPCAFVILRVGQDKGNLDRFFSYIKRALFPPKGFLEEILERRKKITEEIIDKLKQHRKAMPPNDSLRKECEEER